MKIFLKPLFLLIILLTNLHCSFKKKENFIAKEVFRSDGLIITQITENAYIHTSFLQTNDFGNVPCNGLIVSNNQEAAIYDTPTDDAQAAALISWVNKVLNSEVVGVISTHFHDDCLGGLKAFHDKGIPSYGYVETIELAKQTNVVVPQNSFKDLLDLKVGSVHALSRFFGEGHTKDNVVGYFPSENILFGGCLIKELDATKGYLGDSNVSEWSSTVNKIKNEYPNVKIVVPGHGAYGDQQLLDYTIALFKVP